MADMDEDTRRRLREVVATLKAATGTPQGFAVSFSQLAADIEAALAAVSPPRATWRTDVEILASGQPRPYADHHGHTRVTFTWFRAWAGDPADPRSGWEPVLLNEDQVRAVLPHLRCGWPTKPPGDHWDTRLLSLENTAPGVWEFHTSTPYTG